MLYYYKHAHAGMPYNDIDMLGDALSDWHAHAIMCPLRSISHHTLPPQKTQKPQPLYPPPEKTTNPTLTQTPRENHSMGIEVTNMIY